MKFKSGDRVIGNSLANMYGITRQGYIATVRRQHGNGTISIIDDNDNDFAVSERCFDLIDENRKGVHKNKFVALFDDVK